MPSSCQGRGGEGRVQEDTRGDEAARLFTRMRECYSQPALTSCFKPAMALCCSINRVCKSCKNNALRVTRHAPQSQASHSASASQEHKQTAISITSTQTNSHQHHKQTQTAQVPERTHSPASQSRAAHPQTPCWPALTRQLQRKLRVVRHASPFRIFLRW